MREKTLYTIILFAFTLSFFSEATSQSLNYKESSLASDRTNTSHFSAEVWAEHTDIEHNDCHSHTTHCSHHCSGLHNVIVTKHSVKLDKISDTSSKITWYLTFHFDEPFLDPGLKPPILS